MATSLHLSVRIPSTDKDFKRFEEMVKEWDAKKQSRSAMIADGLRLLLEYKPVYADNAEGKLAQLKNVGNIDIDFLLPQFDIINARLDFIIEKLITLEEKGFSQQAIESVIEEDDLPPEMLAELKARFNSMNG